MFRTGDYYTIKREGENFIAVSNVDNNTPQLFFGAVKDLNQYRMALIATEADGSYSVYLPTLVSGTKCYYPSTFRAELIISGILEYQCFRDFLLLRKDGYFIFLYVFYNPAYYFSQDTIQIEKQECELQKLYTKELQPREDLCVEDAIVCTADGGVDYMIKSTHTAKIVKLGKAAFLDTTGYIKAINEKGESICNGKSCALNPCEHIVPFSEEENDRIKKLFYSHHDYVGYYSTNSDEIVGATIFQKQYEQYPYANIALQINLEKPAKALCLISHFWPDKSPNYQYVNIWKVSFVDGDEKLFVDCSFGQYFVDL